jgi:hypothetical protein
VTPIEMPSNVEPPTRTVSEMDAVFRKLDKDGSGGITAHEIKRFFKVANKARRLCLPRWLAGW